MGGIEWGIAGNLMNPLQKKRNGYSMFRIAVKEENR
jgi:hypothetical protein